MQTNNVLKKFDHDHMVDIISELSLPQELMDNHVLEQKTDMQIVSTLVNAEQIESAIKFLALGLPKREAIWWSCICVREVEENKECIKTQDALLTIQDWVKNPDEEKRRLAGKLGEMLEFCTPTSWAATAVFWSGGSIAPIDMPPAEAELFMCGEAVANAIIFAAEQSEKPKDIMELYLKRGLHIAMNGNGMID